MKPPLLRLPPQNQLSLQASNRNLLTDYSLGQMALNFGLIEELATCT